MKRLNSLFIIISLLLLLPINILALDINVPGSGRNPGGGSQTGGPAGTAKVIIFQSVGFKVSRYKYDYSNPSNKITRIINSRYYIRDPYLNKNWDMSRVLKDPDRGVYRLNSNNLETVCQKNYNSMSFTYDSINSGKFVTFSNPSGYTVFKGTAGTTSDMGVTFDGQALIDFLNSSANITDDKVVENSFLAKMIEYLYNTSSINNITSNDVRNEYVLIEPLYMFRYPGEYGSAYIMTVKDMYLFGISKYYAELNNSNFYTRNGSYMSYMNDIYAPGATASCDTGLPNYYNDAMGSIFTQSDIAQGGAISQGYNWGSSFTRGNAACWNHGIGAVFIDMANAMTADCGPNECCFEKTGENTYKYHSDYNTGNHDEWKQYRVKDEYISEFFDNNNNNKKSQSNDSSKFQICGCDPEDENMCCYEYNGTSYVYNSGLNADTVNKQDYYQFIDATTHRPVPAEDGRAGEFKSCGCDPATECCYDADGSYQGIYEGGYGIENRYSLINNKAVPCWCANKREEASSCDDPKAIYKQVNSDDLICLANFDDDELRSQNPDSEVEYTVDVANKVGCETEYAISYPGDQGSANNGELLKIINENINASPIDNAEDNREKIMQLAVTTRCVSFNQTALNNFNIKGQFNYDNIDGKFTYEEASDVIKAGLDSNDYFTLYSSSYEEESGNEPKNSNGVNYFQKEYTKYYYFEIPEKRIQAGGIVEISPNTREGSLEPKYLNSILVAYSTKAAVHKFTTKIDGSVTDPNGHSIDFGDGLKCNYTVTNSGTKWFYRTIDLDNMNKLSRRLGSNWSEGVGPQVQAEIETTGNYTTLTSRDKFSFTLDPATMIRIREYNKEEAEKGGYNDTEFLVKPSDETSPRHWYSPFLYCLYYGNTSKNFCNPAGGPKEIGPIGNSVSVTFINGNAGLEKFSGYTSISGTGGADDPYDLETNISKLIDKQKNLENN